jgi:hypothetical protein
VLAGMAVLAGAAAATASGEVAAQRANSIASSGWSAPSGMANVEPP